MPVPPLSVVPARPCAPAGEAPTPATVAAAVRRPPASALRLCDRDLVVEVDILDGVEQLDALLHRPLERLAAGDEAHASRALVDHRGAHGVLEVARTRRRAAAVDQPGAT